MKRFVLIVMTFLALMVVRGFAAEKPPKAPETRRPTVVEEAAPIMLDGKELFRIRGKILSLAPKDRARLINDRLSKLAENPLTPRNPVMVSDGEITSELFAGEILVMVVTEQDATREGKNRTLLAREYATRINTTLEVHRDERSLQKLLLGGMYAFLATVALIFLLLVFRAIYSRFATTISVWQKTRLRSVKIQSFEVINADRIATSLLLLAKLLHVVLVLVIFYSYISLVLSFFPWTSAYTTTLLGYAMSPLRAIGASVVTFLPKLVFIVVVALVMRYVIKGIKLLFAELEKGSITISGFYPEWAEPTFKIVRFMLIAFTAVIVFPYLPGSGSPAFKGVSIFLGILFSLGSSSAVANVVAGTILTYTRAFTTGDRVRIGDNIGDVIEKNLLAIHIRTLKNVEVTIPNSLVLGSHTLNYTSLSKDTSLILHTSVTIGYDTPWRTVHELLISAAMATKLVLTAPAPFVLQTSLNDFYVSYELNAHTDDPHAMARTYSELHQNIQDAFNEGGVEIMSPHYTQIRDGNRSTIPERYLPEGYEPPALRVSQTETSR